MNDFSIHYSSVDASLRGTAYDVGEDLAKHFGLSYDDIHIFADINFMKKINDGYGHLNGDLAIKATARALRNALSEDWLFGRYGGDEFIAVGPGEPTIDIDKYRADFAAAMNDMITNLKLSFELSASLGYCIIAPDNVGYIGDFIRIADTSMYEEKQRMHKLLS